MGTSFDRSKKRIQLWKKALIQFSLCFVMGFFSGFAPTTTTSSFFSSSSTSTSSSISFQSPQPFLPNTTTLFSPPSSTSTQPSLDLQTEPEDSEDMTDQDMSAEVSQKLEEEDEEEVEKEEEEEEEPQEDSIIPNKLLIIVTTTSSRDPMREVKLRRLSHTLSLVPPPLLWIVVEDHLQAPKTADTLRKTGVMYRHLTVKENFTDHPSSHEADFQRNLALNHIEHHRLNGIVHFATLSNVYDLQFFQEIRDIEVFGTWPVAMLSANRKRVLVEGPVCNSLQVVGWRKKDFSKGSSAMSYYYSRIQEINNNNNNNNNNNEVNTNNNNNNNKGLQEINISGFAFNSSILWDPERWGRSSSVPRNSQDSIKFVQQVVLEDEAKLRAIPSDCSKIMLWNFHVPRNLTFYQAQTKR